MKLNLALAAIFVAALTAAGPALAGDRAAVGTMQNRTNTHPSAQGVENSNGRHAMDRDTRLDRARERMSSEGLAHNQALDNERRSNGADDTDTPRRR